MKNPLPITAILCIFFLSLGFWGCTNSNPVRSDDDVFLTNTDTIRLYKEDLSAYVSLTYVAQGGMLAWYVSYKPDWVNVNPSSGYMTNQTQWVEVYAIQDKVSLMDTSIYYSKITIHTSEAEKNLVIKFTNK